MTHMIPKSIRKYFTFKYGIVRKHKTTSLQERALHTLKIHHKHVYKDSRTGKNRIEEYFK